MRWARDREDGRGGGEGVRSVEVVRGGGFVGLFLGVGL